MSRENLEIVRRGFEAFNEKGVEGIIPFIDPEFVAVTPPDLASEPDTYRGHDGIRRWFDSFYEVMDEIRWDGHASTRPAIASSSSSPCAPAARPPGSTSGRTP